MCMQTIDLVSVESEAIRKELQKYSEKKLQKIPKYPTKNVQKPASCPFRSLFAFLRKNLTPHPINTN